MHVQVGGRHRRAPVSSLSLCGRCALYYRARLKNPLNCLRSRSVNCVVQGCEALLCGGSCFLFPAAHSGDDDDDDDDDDAVSVCVCSGNRRTRTDVTNWCNSLSVNSSPHSSVRKQLLGATMTTNYVVEVLRV